MANHRIRFTSEKREKFLAELREMPNVSRAARRTAISVRTAYDHRATFPDFAADWEDAISEGIEHLEEEAMRRGLKDSDTLLIFLLKAHRPDKYRETFRQELTGKDGAPIEVSDARDKLADLITRRIAAEQADKTTGGTE